MSQTIITNEVFTKMMISGANNIINNKQVLNDLNVFPVPDGDTGTNMSMTISAAITELCKYSTASVSQTSEIIANASLRGARGNSGVILSQLLRGISKALKGKETLTAEDLINTFVMSSDTAYRAVMKPTEGTILTVARLSAEAAKAMQKKATDVVELYEVVYNASCDALAKTQEMLPQLKQAGVVDSGGQGLVFFFEGAYHVLKTGNIIEKTDKTADVTETVTKVESQVDIKFAYCTEFIIEKKKADVNIVSFKNSIEDKGDCMLVIDGGDVVKVHIHTNNPGFVLEQAIRLGMLNNIKIDNMKYQHENIIATDMNDSAKDNEPNEEIMEHTKYAFVSVSSGEGLKELFLNLGVNRIIEGGQTMNPSTDDILNEVSKLSADTIFVFPNNKNIILAAEQAKEISDKNVVVVPTTSIPQAVSALLAFNNDADEETNIKNMENTMKDIKVGQVTFAVRDTNIDGTEIHSGDYMGLIGKKIVACGTDVAEVTKTLVSELVDDDTEIITLYHGSDVSQDEAEEMNEYIEDLYEDCDVIMHNGGQPLYYYIVSAE